MQNPIEKPDYRGKRAALYLRVSTEDQRKNYSFLYQERDCRVLVEQLSMTLDAERHIVMDAYTGMEWHERPELNRLLEMARHQEFDVLIMWKLDRFARRGIHQSIIREELKYHGVSILTLDPDEHADDESELGEAIRASYGFVAETEHKNILERMENGKRERVREGKLLGTGYALYGYAWRSDKPKEKDAYVIVPEEAETVQNIYRWYLEGMTIRGIAIKLNHMGVKTRMAKAIEAGAAKPKRISNQGPIWQPATIYQILTHPFYTGNAAMFKHRDLARVPGKKQPPREIRPENEWIKLPSGVVPTIIDTATWNAVQEKLEANKRNSMRNNKNPHKTLLRSGLAKCGYCGGTMGVHRQIGHYKGRDGKPDKDCVQYACIRGKSGFGRCRAFNIVTHIVDDAAWTEALKVISNPSLVNEKINTLRSNDLTQERRTRYTNKLAEIEQKQKRLRDRLEDEDLDPETYQDIKLRLKRYAEEKVGYEEEFKRSKSIHEKWRELERRLDELHQCCAEMREKMSHPEYIPSYEQKREACELFGIHAIIWAQDHKPRFEIKCEPPSIARLLS